MFRTIRQTRFIGLKSKNQTTIHYSDLAEQKFVNKLSPNQKKELLTFLHKDRKALIEEISLALKKDPKKELLKADKNNDGIISRTELRYHVNQMTKNATNTVSENGNIIDPTRSQLFSLFLLSFFPFVAFGAVDNGILIVAGDLIDNNIGKAFAISTLAAAGLGNLFSDVVGVVSQGSIEKISSGFLKAPNLSIDQLKLPKVKYISMFASVVGISVGCLLGLFPLLFIDPNERRLREIFESIDKNDSGFIEKEELNLLIEASSTLVGAHVIMIADDIHNNNDNGVRLDYDEFKNFIKLIKIRMKDKESNSSKSAFMNFIYEISNR